MNLELIREQLFTASTFIVGKSNKTTILTVSCGVRYVDWEKKIFSPVFCALWKRLANGALSFIPPSSANLAAEAAITLNCAPSEIHQLVESCYWNSGSSIHHKIELTIPDEMMVSPRLPNISNMKYSRIQIEHCSDSGILELAKELNISFPRVKPLNLLSEEKEMYSDNKPQYSVEIKSNIPSSSKNSFFFSK